MTAVLADIVTAHAEPACAGTPGHWWYPPENHGPGNWSPDPETVALCASCPVFARCHQYSEEHKPFGVWAGRFRNQRDSRYQTPELLAEVFQAHGTPSARKRHHRRNEPLCEDCERSLRTERSDRRGANR